MPEQLQLNPSANGQHADRRTEERQAMQGTAMVESAHGDGQRFTAQIVNVSDGGIKLKVRNHFDEGSMVRIDLPCDELGPVTTVLACVMHSQHEGYGLYSVGCQFCSELDDADLDSLGVARREGEQSDADTRNYPRFPTRAQVVYRNLRSPAEPACPGTVVNVSPNGVGLNVKDPLTPGALLDLTVQDDQGKKLFEILACVVYRHTNRDGQYTVGCNFIRELTEYELGTLN